MAQNNDRNQFVVQSISAKGPIHMTQIHKISLLENKIIFYEGQVDPLYDQTIVLKQNIMALSRLVAISTQILRNLLPSNNDPAKKLKLQMSNIQQISKMIDEDWKHMESVIQKLKKKLIEQQQATKSWMQKYYNQNVARMFQKEQFQRRLSANRQNLQQKDESIRNSFEKLKERYQMQKERLRQEIFSIDNLLRQKIKQFQLYKHEVRLKNEEYQKTIQRLNRHIEMSLSQFQQSKKVVKQLCQKLMNQKLAQESQNYEYMLKVKEEQKFGLSVKIDQIEQEKQRIKTEKDKQIQKNYQKINNLKKKVSQLNESIEIRDETITEKSNRIQNLQAKVSKIGAQLQRSYKQIQKITQSHEQNLKVHVQKAKTYQQSIKVLRQSGEKTIFELVQKNQQMQNQINTYQNELIQLKANLQQIQVKNNQKIIGLKNHFQQLQTKLRQTIKQREQKIEEMNFKSDVERQQQQRSIRYLKQQYLDIFNQKQKQYEKLVLQLKNNVKYQINQAVQQKQKQMQKIINYHQQRVQAQRQKAQEMSLELQRKKYLEIEEAKLKGKDQLKRKQVELNDLVLQRRQLTERLKEYQDRMEGNQRFLEQQKLNMLKRIHRYEQQVADQRQKLNDQLQAQTNIFQNEFFAREKAMNNMKDEYQEEIVKRQDKYKKMREKLMQEIYMLKQENGIDIMQKRFNAEINNLRVEMQNKIKQIEDIKLKQFIDRQNLHQQELISMKQDYQNQLFQINSIHQKNMLQIILAAQIKGFQSIDRQIFGISQQNLQICGQDLKKSYALYCINKMQNIVFEKMKLIEQLNDKIASLQQNFDKVLQEKRRKIDQFVENKVKECDQKISKIEEECMSKVAVAVNQRQNYSYKMYEQFKLLQENHKQMYDKLLMKYTELESCFAQRPSRQEDVFKIKQLSDMKKVLSLQINKYHKKMETANQIVKYLNLQLENYKQTYDIFRPSPEITNFTNLAANSIPVNPNSLKITNASINMMVGLQIPNIQKGKTVPLQNSLKDYLQKNLKITNFLKDSQKNTFKNIKNFIEQENDDDSVLLKSKEADPRNRKFSHNIQKNIHKKQKLKTQKPKQQGQIFSYAQSFMNIIKQQKKMIEAEEKDKYNDDYKKGQQTHKYRRRKLKTLNSTTIHQNT